MYLLISFSFTCCPNVVLISVFGISTLT